MRITSIELRNFRVFGELSLEIPPGLVGVYGPNGAGKSSLLESIVWALYGRSRTGKGQIRTAGETGDCVVELGFEHEENHYLVRRSLGGKNATIKARVTTGDTVLADGVTDVAKYVQSILGLDELAFRSSVFAEQKQLAAFSDQSPEQRRKLVLQLLGITPIEAARDAARADARQRQREHAALQAILGTASALESRLSDAETAVAYANADEQRLAAREADAAAAAVVATEAYQALAIAAAESERIRSLGGAVRKRRDELVRSVESLELEATQSEHAIAELASLPNFDPARASALQGRVQSLITWEAAVRRLEALPPSTEVVEPTDSAVRAAQESSDGASADLARVRAVLDAAEQRVALARDTASRHEELTSADGCPLCGQELGQGFDEVRRHSQAELHDALVANKAADSAVTAQVSRAKEAKSALEKAKASFEQAHQVWQKHLSGMQRRDDAQRAVSASLETLGGSAHPSDLPSAQAELEALQQHRVIAAALQERVDRLPIVQKSLAEATQSLADAERERAELLEALRALSFDSERFEVVKQEQHETSTAATKARSDLEQARLTKARAEQQVVGIHEALADAEEKQRALAEVETQARYLGRTAELLNGFRQTVVALVGPQLSAHASALFNDLTAGEYDGLAIDGETYAIQVLDAGVAYDSSRFSGSEVDLANLSLRVAISEQIRFQSGGQVGLLVLDEALASLDSDRKDRMLGALTRLGGRFRQILVVTHSPDVKERLPQAVEVFRVGHRRSSARLIDPSGL